MPSQSQTYGFYVTLVLINPANNVTAYNVSSLYYLDGESNWYVDVLPHLIHAW